MVKMEVALSTAEALKARPVNYFCRKCRHEHMPGYKTWESHLKHASHAGVLFDAGLVVKALEAEGVHLDATAWRRVWQRAWKSQEAGV